MTATALKTECTKKAQMGRYLIMIVLLLFLIVVVLFIIMKLTNRGFNIVESLKELLPFG